MNSPILLGSIASILSTASLVFTIVFFVLIAFGALWALKRSLILASVRLGTLMFAIIFSLIGTLVLKNMLGTLLEGIVAELLSEESIASIIKASPSLTDLSNGLPGALVSPLLFFFLFLFLNINFLVVYVLLKRIPAFKKELKCKAIDRSLGAVIGAVTMVLILACFIIPFSGYVQVADDVLSTVAETDLDEKTEAEVVEIQNYISPFADNIAFKTSNVLLDKVVFENLVSCKVKGENINLVNEIAYLATTYTTMTPLIDVGFDFTEFSDEQAAAFRQFANDFDNSVLIPNILCELLPEVANEWNNGSDFIGIESPVASAPDNLQPLMTSAFDIMGTTTRETLKGDLVTICELLATLSENGTFANLSGSSSQDILKTLSGPGVISGLVDILYENERTRTLVADLTNIGFDAIGDSLDIPATDEDVRAELTKDLNEAIQNATKLEGYEAQVDDLSDSIADIFSNYGVTATEDEIELYAQAIIGYGPITSEGEGEASADTYFSIIGSAMAAVNGTPTAGSITLLSTSETEDERTEKLHALIRDYQAQNGNKALENAQGVTDMISGKTNLVHKVVTFDDIHVVKNELFVGSAESFHNQTLALEEIIIVLYDAFVDSNGEFVIDYKTLDTASLSSALHKLAGTRTDADGNELHNLSNALTNIVKYALQEIGFDPSAADELVEHIVEKEKDNTGKKDTLSATVALATILESSSESTDSKEQVTSLVQDLDGASAKVLSGCITPNLITNFTTTDIGKERTKALCDVTKDMLDNFGDLSDELSEEQMEAEATYVQTIFALATVADDGSVNSLFSSEENEDSKLGKTADEFVATLNDSIVISQTILEETDSLKVAVSDKMDQKDKVALKAAVDNNTELSAEMRNALNIAFSLNNIAE